MTSALVAWATFGAGAVLTRLRSADMRIILGSITASTLYGVPSRLVVVVVLGLCPLLLGGWFAQSSGNWNLFERSGSITSAIGLVVASRRYFQYGVHELAMLRSGDELKSEMAKMQEDVLDSQDGLSTLRVRNDRLGLGRIPRVVELQLPAGVGLVRLSRYPSGFHSVREKSSRRGRIRYFPRRMRSVAGSAIRPRSRALAQPNNGVRDPCTNIDPGSPEGGRPSRRDSEPAELRTDP